jgi:hypothetical protein
MVREPKRVRRRRRRPTLSAALKAARATGVKIRSATIDSDGRITITFGEPVEGTNENDWDRKLAESERGKH